jgi:predicted ATPase/tetratricopeptide (TPR) repeat protein
MSSDAHTRNRSVASQPLGEPRWQIRLLGTVAASDGVQHLERFPSRAVAALLARLALAPDRVHPREELVELLWPGVALDVGRNRLRQVLSTLKSMLEPPGQPGAAVIQADRHGVRAVDGALGCDARQFEQMLRAGRTTEALALYRGDLMPGYYEDWIGEERHRLAALHESLQQQARPDLAPEAAAPHPPPTTPRPSAAHLPAYLTRLFGAEMAEARLRAQVRSHRLVTLLGPGGCGKTRLAVEVAQALRDRPAWSVDGAAEPAFECIAFVPLVSCDDAAQMLRAITRVVQLPSGGADDVQHLVQALAGQRVLLVLDNFEQLVGRAEGMVAALLEQLPLLHLLVTSRRVLGLDGEHGVPAEPLGLPAADAGLAAAGASAAVALFVDRARAVRADFHLGERNHRAVLALVRALHGMPLAIELAASRVRSVSPADMLALLAAPSARGAHLGLLARSGPRAGHDPRHASMAQVIAWSWQLLDAPAQRMLAVLSLFAADAPLQGVAGVLGEEPVRVAAGLDELVQHSLVRTAKDEDGDAAGGPRFGLVEPVREYVATQLDAAQAGTLRGQLRQWLIRWARGLGPAPAPARVAPEMPTVHAALATALADVAPRDALDLALALRAHWDTDALPATLQQVLEQALQAVSEEGTALDGLRADAHEMLAYLRFESGFVPQARAHADAALQAAGHDTSRRARALVRRAWVELAANRTDDKAGAHLHLLRAWLDESRQLAEACGDVEAQARTLHQLAVLASHFQGDWAGAEALLAQSQTLWQALGDRRKVNARLRNRAQCWVHLGRADQAQASFEHCEQKAREDGDWVGQIDSQLSLASLLGNRREWAASVEVSRRCVRLCWQRWHRHGLAYGLWNLPRMLARLRQPEAAMRLMGFAATLWQTSFGPLGRADLSYVRRVRVLVAAQVGAARAEALWAEGGSLDVAQAVAIVLNE